MSLPYSQPACHPLVVITTPIFSSDSLLIHKRDSIDILFTETVILSYSVAMKVSHQYAKRTEVSFKTEWYWYRADILDVYQTSTGIIIAQDNMVGSPLRARLP
jgi:hypothetical protein